MKPKMVGKDRKVKGLKYSKFSISYSNTTLLNRKNKIIFRRIFAKENVREIK